MQDTVLERAQAPQNIVLAPGRAKQIASAKGTTTQSATRAKEEFHNRDQP